MNSKKPNPYNSDSLQAWLDLQMAMDRTGIYLTDPEDITHELLRENSKLRQEADTIMHHHEYPDKCIGFSQSVRYDKKTLFYELPRAEQILYNLMCDIQDPQSGFVTVIKHIFAKVLHYTDTERRHLQHYLDDLTDKGFLICNYRATNKKPGEYRINRSISWIGKQNLDDLNILQTFNSEYTIGKSTVVLKNGTTVTSGTLQIKDIKNIKNGVSAGHTDPKSKLHTSSEPQNDSTPNTGKNQHPVINMQNKNILSPEENSPFELEEHT